ncbi:MAG TPA: condensation domain-containing protein, partial [Cytophagales bacterium]
MSFLLKELKENNVGISLAESGLKVKFNGSVLPHALINKVKENKAALVEYLGRLNGERVEIDIKKVVSHDGYPLSSCQRRVWILSQYEQGNVAYNMPGACVLEGQLHRESLAYAADALIARHESLRTVFREDVQGEVRQFICPPAELQFAIAQQRVPNAGELRRLVGEEFARPFNLAAGPLLRISLFESGDGAWVLAYVMHHIISDGWSLNILRDEMLLLYNAHRQGRQNPLPPLRIQYKDYAVWQQSYLRGDALAAHRAYWLRQFAGNLPVLELAKSKLRPAVRTYNGRAITRRVRSAPGEGLKAALQQHGSSLFMGLLSVVYALLHKHTGAEDIIIGSPIAGREHMDLENQIGFYANTVALRTRFGAGYNFRQLLEAVRKTTLDA